MAALLLGASAVLLIAPVDATAVPDPGYALIVNDFSPTNDDGCEGDVSTSYRRLPTDYLGTLLVDVQPDCSLHVTWDWQDEVGQFTYLDDVGVRGLWGHGPQWYNLHATFEISNLPHCYPLMYYANFYNSTSVVPYAVGAEADLHSVCYAGAFGTYCMVGEPCTLPTDPKWKTSVYLNNQGEHRCRWETPNGVVTYPDPVTPNYVCQVYPPNIGYEGDPVGTIPLGAVLPDESVHVLVPRP